MCIPSVLPMCSMFLCVSKIQTNHKTPDKRKRYKQREFTIAPNVHSQCAPYVLYVSMCFKNTNQWAQNTRQMKMVSSPDFKTKVCPGSRNRMIISKSDSYFVSEVSFALGLNFKKNADKKMSLFIDIFLSALKIKFYTFNFNL